MTKTVRIAVKAAGALAVLAIAAGGGIRWWLGKKLSPEALVTQMESAWNCRAHIDAVKLSLWSSPASIEITGCRVAKLDAETAKPLAQRQPLDLGQLEASVEKAVLEVKLQDLLAGRLNIRQLTLSFVAVREEISPDGISSLGDVFKKRTALSAAEPAVAVAPESQPAVPPSPPVPAAVPPAAAPPPPVPPAPDAVPDAKAAVSKTSKPARPRKEITADQLGFSILVERASIQDGLLRINNRKTKNRTELDGLHLTISGIDIDPDDLANHNLFNLEISGHIVVHDRIKTGKDSEGKDIWRPIDVCDLHFAGNGVVHPFDPQTGKAKASSDLSLTLKQGSTLMGHLTIGETGSKDLKKLDEWGIDLNDVKIGGPLQQDAAIRTRFSENRLTILEPAVFSLPDYELAILAESWLNSSDDQHEMNLRLSIAKGLRDRIVEGIAKSKVVGKYGSLVENLAKVIVEKLSDERGRMFFDVKSKERLSKPKLEFDTSELLDRALGL